MEVQPPAVCGRQPPFAIAAGGLRRPLRGSTDRHAAGGRCFRRSPRNHAELLPLQCDAGSYWAVNVLTTVDLLDEEQAEGYWFAPGRLMELRRLVARRNAPRELPPIFKLPQWRKGAALVTEEFMDTVSEHRLTGLDPEQVGEV